MAQARGRAGTIGALTVALLAIAFIAPIFAETVIVQFNADKAQQVSLGAWSGLRAGGSTPAGGG